jgi:hypothetical protein
MRNDVSEQPVTRQESDTLYSEDVPERLVVVFVAVLFRYYEGTSRIPPANPWQVGSLTAVGLAAQLV